MPKQRVVTPLPRPAAARGPAPPISSSPRRREEEALSWQEEQEQQPNAAAAPPKRENSSADLVTAKKLKLDIGSSGRSAAAAAPTQLGIDRRPAGAQHSGGKEWRTLLKALVSAPNLDEGPSPEEGPSGEVLGGGSPLGNELEDVFGTCRLAKIVQKNNPFFGGDDEEQGPPVDPFSANDDEEQGPPVFHPPLTGPFFADDEEFFSGEEQEQEFFSGGDDEEQQLLPYIKKENTHQVHGDSNNPPPPIDTAVVPPASCPAQDDRQFSKRWGGKKWDDEEVFQRLFQEILRTRVFGRNADATQRRLPTALDGKAPLSSAVGRRRWTEKLIEENSAGPIDENTHQVHGDSNSAGPIDTNTDQVHGDSNSAGPIDSAGQCRVQRRLPTALDGKAPLGELFKQET